MIANLQEINFEFKRLPKNKHIAFNPQRQEAVQQSCNLPHAASVPEAGTPNAEIPDAKRILNGPGHLHDCMMLPSRGASSDCASRVRPKTSYRTFRNPRATFSRMVSK